MLKIAVTGGIGSGKSSLSNHFIQSGVPYYDSDRRAKELMLSDADVKVALRGLFGERAFEVDLDGVERLDRAYIAKEIFADGAKREALNAIVHPAVVRDFERWASDHEQRGEHAYVIFESAILFDAGLEANFDKSVVVMAPEEVRLTRVVNRDGCTVEQARGRMAAQMSEDEMHKRADYSVVNIFEDDLAGAAQRLDQIFKAEAIRKERR